MNDQSNAITQLLDTSKKLSEENLNLQVLNNFT